LSRSSSISPGEVQVWVGSLAAADNRVRELSALLSADERERVRRLPEDRARRYTIGRGVLRRLLADFTGEKPRDFTFEYNDAGKPFLPEGGIEFNISHSADLVLYAFSADRSVGVDVERLRPVRRLLDVALRFMTENDVRRLEAAPPSERDEMFLRSWVVREARLKAEGQGIWSRLAAHSGLPEREPDAEDEPPGSAVSRELGHKLFAPKKGYIAAVAASGMDWKLLTCALSEPKA